MRKLISIIFFPLLLVAQNSGLAKLDSINSSDDIDTIIVYSARDSIKYSFKSKSMKLYGNSSVEQGPMSLKSSKIDIDWGTNTLLANGEVDSTKNQNNSLKERYIGLPKMNDGGDEYEGFQVAYNFKTKKGKVVLGDTEQEQGYYHGQQIKKIEQKILFVANGRYTTCDDVNPHFYFYSPQMKISLRDKIIAKPIYLFIADIPVFALPFGVFPNQHGRRSGIIAPTYGEHWQRGRYISHLGYYWAANDYFDINFLTDIYSKGGWRGYSDLHYSLKYNFSGRLFFDYSKIKIGEDIDYDRKQEENYRVNVQHYQQLNPTSRLDVDFTFASNNSYKTSNTYEDLLRQEIYSNATFNKTFEGTNNSLNINISRRHDLRTGNIYATLPSINFSIPQIYPFRSLNKSRGIKLVEIEQKWYEYIGASYNTQFIRYDNKTFTNDRSSFSTNDNYGGTHNFSINASPKFKYITLTPYFNYNERWYYNRTEIDSVDDKNNPIEKNINGFSPVRFFGGGISASTRLYGMLNLPIKGFGGLRHTLLPSISYFYQPDFSKTNFGYFGSYTDKFGKQIKFNKFQNSVFGGAPSGESQSLNFNLSNLFEMKTILDDSARTEKKYQLLNLNASTSYNFSAPEFKMSDLFLSFRTDIAQILNISGGANYRFYDFENHKRVNKFLWDEKNRIADLTNVNFSLSASFRGEKSKKPQSVIDSLRLIEAEENKLRGYKNLYENDPPDFSIPWNLSLSFYFSQNQEDPSNKFRSANLNGNLSFNLTDNWKFTASSNYDLIRKEFAAPFITIYRDLHCWEMNFSWTPTGYLKGYRFELRVKAPHLQDVKLTKQSREVGYF